MKLDTKWTVVRNKHLYFRFYITITQLHNILFISIRLDILNIFMSCMITITSALTQLTSNVKKSVSLTETKAVHVQPGQLTNRPTASQLYGIHIHCMLYIIVPLPFKISNSNLIHR